MLYCQQNPQECQKFFGGQGGVFGGPQGGFEGQRGGPQESFNRPQSGPGGCQGFEECSAYCSDPAHAQECGQTGGGQGGFSGGPQGGGFPNPSDFGGQFPTEGFSERNPQKCPDGIWDEAEQRDPNLCPEDSTNFNQPAEQPTETTEQPQTT